MSSTEHANVDRRLNERLAVIDVAGSRQPLSNEDGTVFEIHAGNFALTTLAIFNGTVRHGDGVHDVFDR